MYDFRIQFYYQHEPAEAGLFIIKADDLGQAIHTLQNKINAGEAPIFDYWSVVA